MERNEYIYGPCPREKQEELNGIQAQSLNLSLELVKEWTKVCELENHRVIHVKDELVGGLAFVEDAQHFGGLPVSCACVSAVAVTPHFRGFGVGKTLVRSLVKELAEREFAISSLYPSSWTFYRSAGYELAGCRSTFKASLSALPKGNKSHEMRPASLTELSELSSMWRKTKAFENGTLSRKHAFFHGKRYLAKDGLQLYKAMKEDTCEGYVSFRLRKEDRAIAIDTICGANDTVLLTILGFLRRFDPFYPEIIWNGKELNELLWLFAEREYRLTHSLPWMTRIVRVDRALEERGYPKSFNGEFHFQIEDALVGENTGPWIMTVENGRAEVKMGGRGEIELDILSLAPLYTGSLCARTLAAKERLKAQENQIENLSFLFGGPLPYLNQMF